ncbi:MAG TPA: hypothetical protein PLH43_11780, partial [Acetivibrio sp.]|uniref:hypothetical protein n=1 Tax=Acetivibrio sp. TaxID=1872092 RepID=UPI002CA14A40
MFPHTIKNKDFQTLSPQAEQLRVHFNVWESFIYSLFKSFYFSPLDINVTHSPWYVCGNISNGWTESISY